MRTATPGLGRVGQKSSVELPPLAGLIRCDVEFKEIAILVALVVLFAVMVRLSAGHLLPADLKHIIFR